MKLFGGMERNELFISVGITFIFCGAISYFCYTRIKNIENAVTKQNQILSSFISNVKNEIQPSFVMDTIASDEAIAAVKSLKQNNNDSEDSEDSDDIDDSDSDDSDDSDENDDSGSGVKNDSGTILVNSNNDYTKTILNKTLMNLGNNIISTTTDINNNSIKIIEMSCSIPPITINNDITQSKIYEIDDETSKIEYSNTNSNSDDTDDTDDTDDSEENDDVPLSSITISENNEETIIDATIIQVTDNDDSQINQPTLMMIEGDDIKTIITATESETNIDKCKVEELRQLVILKGLSSKNEIKKFKKNELITLLKNNE
jgi:hypothetical protein